MRKVKVAMIGVGSISGIYLQNLTHVFKEVELVGLCDLVPERAEKGLAYVEDAIANGADVVKPVILQRLKTMLFSPLPLSKWIPKLSPLITQSSKVTLPLAIPP